MYLPDEKFVTLLLRLTPSLLGGGTSSIKYKSLFGACTSFFGFLLLLFWIICKWDYESFEIPTIFALPFFCLLNLFLVFYYILLYPINGCDKPEKTQEWVFHGFWIKTITVYLCCPIFFMLVELMNYSVVDCNHLDILWFTVGVVIMISTPISIVGVKKKSIRFLQADQCIKFFLFVYMLMDLIFYRMPEMKNGFNQASFFAIEMTFITTGASLDLMVICFVKAMFGNRPVRVENEKDDGPRIEDRPPPPYENVVTIQEFQGICRDNDYSDDPPPYSELSPSNTREQKDKQTNSIEDF